MRGEKNLALQYHARYIYSMHENLFHPRVYYTPNILHYSERCTGQPLTAAGAAACSMITQRGRRRETPTEPQHKH